MGGDDIYNGLTIDKSLAEKAGFNPYYRSIEGAVSGVIKIGSSEYYDLASNNYLGLANDTRVKTAITQAVEKYGASMCGTPIATGSSILFTQLESKLAAFTGLEASAVFPSCYQANSGLFRALGGKNDLILADHYVHASLIEGIRAVGCKIKPFLHNNLNHLESLLKKSGGYGKKIVVTESVFSTEGAIAPFDAIVALCRRYHAIPVVDDSHGIGVIGRNGRGILEHFDIQDYCGIVIASLGKALANSGGVVAGKAKMVEYLKYRCPGLIYSTALSPAPVAGTLAVLEIIDREFPRLGAAIQERKDAVYSCLLKAGSVLTGGAAPITSVVCNTPQKTIEFSRILFENRILSVPFIPPSVPPNTGIVRLIAGACLDNDNMRNILKGLEKTALQVNKG